MHTAQLRPCHQQHRAVVALWLSGLLVVVSTGPTTAVATALCPSTPTSVPPQCQQLARVCVDHSSYVLYDSRHNPRHERFEGLPRINLKNISVNPLGSDDLWGTAQQHPDPILRPASPAEESRELLHPQFSSCTIPIVLYINNLHSQGDLFTNTIAPLYMWQLNQTLDRRLTVVVDTLGIRLQRLHRFLLSPLSAFRVTSLSHISSRMPLDRPEHYNPDGQHVRCFSNLLVCQMHGSGSSAAVQLARSAPIHHPLWSTGQAIFNYYQRRLPAIDPSFADRSKLKVLIAAMPRADNIRAVINQEQVWTWCTNFTPAAAVQGWNGTACLLHEFGRNLLSDLAYTSQADVLLGLHGDTLYWSFFMTQHSSVVEIRPRGFAGPQADRHLKAATAADGDSILWWGIDVVDPAHSAPAQLESQQRGDPLLWARERHVFVRLMACQHIFERIAQAGRSVDAYQQFRQAHQHHITDMLQPATGTDSGSSPADAATAAAAARAATARVSAQGPAEEGAADAQQAAAGQATAHQVAAAASTARVRPSRRR